MAEDGTRDKIAKTIKDLTIKEQKFVKEYSTGDKTATKALLDAGYKPGSQKNAQAMASQIRRKPKIQAALSIELAEAYPDLERDCKNQIQAVMRDPHESALTKLRYMEFAGKVKGWFAPSKTENKSLSATFKLPKE